MIFKDLARDERGATIVELAFAFPIAITFIWMIAQMGMLFRANSGIQHSLGQGARTATLWPTPTATTIKQKMTDAVYGIGPGTFKITVPATPVEDPTDKAKYLDLQVTYEQSTSMLFFPGPEIQITKKKRVWVAS
ncbi:TadE family protein [Sphingomonas humi]|uniref:TadE-like domain-containing protein n=1 Tax=Sphingomonas humi TaxID=335630 RepID=A0ABP7S1G0_9SPHN